MEMVLLIGIPASGKSSFYAQRFAATHVRVNLDMLRTRHRERELFETLLRLEQPMVIDNTNVSMAERERFLAPARAAGFSVHGYYFSSRLAECLPRNEARAGKTRIPEAGVKAAAGRLESPVLVEGFDRLFYVRFAGEEFAVEDWSDEV